ncbi:MAG: lipoyl(octanoyl) transferase LipB [Planctomycetota bacterium]|nr:lipoyl(octanoyl) transferase LipB [Planctomycetota bacterium]
MPGEPPAPEARTASRVPSGPGIHFDWGTAPYAEIHALQERLVEARAAETIPDMLLTGEHPAVITLGRKTPATAVYDPRFDVVEVERGGEATFHGPGQLVAYPIIHLTRHRKDLHAFQRDLEEVGLRTLADFGLTGRRRAGLTGVWIGDRKIQSLGIAVRRWVTWHGLALNVTTDLSAFQTFHPCGLSGDVMISMADALGHAPDFAAVRASLVQHASGVLPGGPYVSGPLPRTLDASAPESRTP